MKKHIPNLITLLNLASGTVALYLVFSHSGELALIFLGISLLMDFMDGTLARLLKVQSELGKQLDSLADLVSFGLLPGVMVFSSMELVSGTFPSGDPAWKGLLENIAMISVVLVPVFAALRLGKFNLQKDVSDFSGLPSPAFAIFWAGIYYALYTQGGLFDRQLSIFFLWALMLITILLMVLPIRMISLKFRNFSLKENIFPYLVLLFGVGLTLAAGIPGLSLAILTYILLSLVRIVLT